MNRAFFSSSHTKFSTNSVNHRGWAWVSLCLALAVHVFDEAMTDFLSVYNPAVQAIRQRFPFFPMPVFTFEVWLTGLIAAIIILLLLSPFAFRKSEWMKLLSYPFAILMLLNGMGHIAGSFYLGRLAPGVYSSPLLLAGSIYLLWSIRRG
ncbi:MAG: HXXEE domain-containing protein [Blastocatellia bacterium]